MCGKTLIVARLSRAAVDDARVVQLVGNHDVVFGEHRGDGAGVGGESALEHDDRFGLLEFRETPFELHVDGHRACDGPHRSRADAERARRLERPLPQRRVRRQAEVVVGREVHDLAMIEGGLRLLLVLQNAQTAVQALLLQRLELGIEET